MGARGRVGSIGVRTATITAAVVLMATVLTVGLLRTPGGDNQALVVEEFESVPLFED